MWTSRAKMLVKCEKLVSFCPLQLRFVSRLLELFSTVVIMFNLFHRCPLRSYINYTHNRKCIWLNLNWNYSISKVDKNPFKKMNVREIQVFFVRTKALKNMLRNPQRKWNTLHTLDKNEKHKIIRLGNHWKKSFLALMKKIWYNLIQNKMKRIVFKIKIISRERMRKSVMKFPSKSLIFFPLYMKKFSKCAGMIEWEPRVLIPFTPQLSPYENEKNWIIPERLRFLLPLSDMKWI